jgi:hypothetical protein
MLGPFRGVDPRVLVVGAPRRRRRRLGSRWWRRARRRNGCRHARTNLRQRRRLRRRRVQHLLSHVRSAHDGVRRRHQLQRARSILRRVYVAMPSGSRALRCLQRRPRMWPRQPLPRFRRWRARVRPRLQRARLPTRIHLHERSGRRATVPAMRRSLQRAGRLLARQRLRVSIVLQLGSRFVPHLHARLHRRRGVRRRQQVPRQRPLRVGLPRDGLPHGLHLLERRTLQAPRRLHVERRVPRRSQPSQPLRHGAQPLRVRLRRRRGLFARRVDARIALRTRDAALRPTAVYSHRALRLRAILQPHIGAMLRCDGELLPIVLARHRLRVWRGCHLPTRPQRLPRAQRPGRRIARKVLLRGRMHSARWRKRDRVPARVPMSRSAEPGRRHGQRVLARLLRTGALKFGAGVSARSTVQLVQGARHLFKAPFGETGKTSRAAVHWNGACTKCFTAEP